jgi:hypothetical protein
VCVCVCMCVCERQADIHEESAKQAGRLESVGKTFEYAIDEHQGGGWEALCCTAQERQSVKYRADVFIFTTLTPRKHTYRHRQSR